PGALSNTPPAPATAPLTQPLNTPADDKKEKTTGNSANREPAQPYNNRSDETTNFEVDRTLIHTKSSAGRIQRLSVAVVINHLPQGEEGKPGPISEAELTRINALVKEAIGYNAARGDSVNILNSAFNGVVEEPVPPFWEQDRFYALLMAIARYLVIAIIAWVMWRKLVQPAWIRHQETTLRRLEMEKEAREEEIAAKKRAAEKINRDRAQQRVDTELNGQQLRELAEQEPRVIALVIRQWMSKEPKQ
ncbi:flagellar basal-body MS-ring/collar protein FliF, partial [Enterobacter cloacae]|uniref:flagellar basal-body MS-ring/collar protein FliF n=2 Tax=Enterobacteriaceae TaxID=543 RepID=UPI002B1E43AB